MKMEPVKSFEAEQLFVDLDKPSLRGLAHVLRHREFWPEGFVWYYGNYNTCAYGMSVRLWDGYIKKVGVFDFDEEMASAFSIPDNVAVLIFMDCGQPKVPRSAVTPEMVAADIDTYLAR